MRLLQFAFSAILSSGCRTQDLSGSVVVVEFQVPLRIRERGVCGGLKLVDQLSVFLMWTLSRSFNQQVLNLKGHS